MNCIRFCFSAICDFLFVCESNISGTAEQICTKFTRKTCLVPRLDEFEFECQGQTSRSLENKHVVCIPITRSSPHSPEQQSGPFCCMTHYKALTANNVRQQQMGPFCRCREVISPACVRFMFGKTSLAVVLLFLFCVFSSLTQLILRCT